MCGKKTTVHCWFCFKKKKIIQLFYWIQLPIVYTNLWYSCNNFSFVYLLDIFHQIIIFPSRIFLIKYTTYLYKCHMIYIYTYTLKKRRKRHKQRISTRLYYWFICKARRPPASLLYYSKLHPSAHIYLYIYIFFNPTGELWHCSV